MRLKIVIINQKMKMSERGIPEHLEEGNVMMKWYNYDFNFFSS